MPDESLDRIVESLGQINVNLECLRVTLSGLSEVAADHEDRLRLIERWKHNLSPFVAIFTFLLGGVASIVLDKLF